MPFPERPFRIAASLVTLVGIGLLVLVVHDFLNGVLAGKFFPTADHTPAHHLMGLLLALPVPLHVIFIGQIVQKRWLPRLWRRIAWIGITGSGLWLGAALVVRLYVL